LVAKSARNRERIFPFLGGQEVNTSPTQRHDRYIINFGQMPLEEAEQWPDLVAILREKVKPERDAQKDPFGQRYWWRFLRPRPEMYDAIGTLERCLVIPQQYPNCVRAAFQPTDRVLSQKLVVIPSSAASSFAVIQSRVHESWVQLFCGRMGAANTPVYSPSDCFETFPFPAPDPRTVLPALEGIGERLYAERAAYMVDTNQGLTQTYNKLKDPTCDEPRILALRALHEDMDRAVLEAYNWSGLTVPPFCSTTPEQERSLGQFQDAIIDRLFLLNAERASAEGRLRVAKVEGDRGSSAPSEVKTSKTRRGETTTPVEQRELFGKLTSPPGDDS
jgi:hypothetical protein